MAKTIGGERRTCNSEAMFSATMLSVATGGHAMASYEPGKTAYAISLAALLLFWPMRRKRAMVIILFALMFVGLNGCGGGSNGNQAANTAAGSYSFNVTATSGGTQVLSAYTLVVQ